MAIPQRNLQRLGEAAVEHLERQDWLEPLADNLQRAVVAAFQAAGETGRRVRDSLHGTWLGHPLHPVLTDVLSFANTSSDCLGSIREPRAKGVRRVRCRTFGILRRPTGRDPGGFRGSEREQADCSGPDACSVVQRTTMLELCGLADVAMVQAADFGKLHDLPCHEELDRPDIRRILVEREVGPRLMVIDEIAGQETAEVSLAKDEHMIQALTPD
jgi:hypothetical protein